MTLDIIIENSCKKDLKLAKKRGKDLKKFEEIARRLARGEKLDPRYRPHRLGGIWYPYWECHIEPDWLLIYHWDDEYLYLVRVGTHSDLFD